MHRAILRLSEGGLTRFKMIGTPLPPLPALTNVLEGSEIFWWTDKSYGAPDLSLRPVREGIRISM